VFFTLDGELLGTAFTDIDLSKPLYPLACLAGRNTCIFVNYGASEFVWEPPAMLRLQKRPDLTVMLDTGFKHAAGVKAVAGHPCYVRVTRPRDPAHVFSTLAVTAPPSMLHAASVLPPPPSVMLAVVIDGISWCADNECGPEWSRISALAL
jgi:hypothetical protein